MRPSKYLEAFKLANGLDKVELIGDAILVEKIPPEEKKTKSGLIVTTHLDHKQTSTLGQDLPTFVHVIAVGKGYYDPETKEDVPLSIQPGDIILVGQLSVKWFSFMDIDGYEPYSVGLTREAEMQFRFKGAQAYSDYFKAINDAQQRLGNNGSQEGGPV